MLGKGNAVGTYYSIVSIGTYCSIVGVGTYYNFVASRYIL